MDTSVWSLALRRDRPAITAHFATLPFLTPDRHDHFEAAQLRNRARRRGVNADFARIGEQEPLERWTP